MGIGDACCWRSKLGSPGPLGSLQEPLLGPANALASTSGISENRLLMRSMEGSFLSAASLMLRRGALFEPLSAATACLPLRPEVSEHSSLICSALRRLWCCDVFG